MSWFYIAGIAASGTIHPEDIGLLSDSIDGCLARVVDHGEISIWRTVEIQDVRIRLDASVLQPCPAPDFVYGECVRTVPPRTLREGLVFRIGWHIKLAKPFFLLRVDGRPYKSQFWAHELCRGAR